MFEGPLEDRILIRERYGSYSDAVFRKDLEAWLSQYCETGTWELMGQQHTGKAMLKAQWETLWSGLNQMGFFAEIGAIEITGDHATVRSYCREIVELKSGKIIKVAGRYDDELVKENGIWLFAKRQYRALIREPG